MGFRYRKSINFGGGFRINLSKSGIGYSWGIRGYRITKTAKGTTRTTLSLPGTGLSYVRETSKGNNRSNRSTHAKQSVPTSNNSYDTYHIANTDASELVSEGLEEMLAATRKSLKLKQLASIGFWSTFILGFGLPICFILTAGFGILMNYVRTKGMIDLEYDIEADQQAIVDHQINPIIKITECTKVWRLLQTSRVIDQKYASGASNTVKRTPCTASTKPPFPFRTNVKAASFKVRNETLLFLPDKLFIIQGNKIGALNYSDISKHFDTTRFIESETVPKDAQVVGQTWKYVNKSGGPDKRFKDNSKLPICLYGRLKLTSTSGLNTIIMYSNPEARS